MAAQSGFSWRARRAVEALLDQPLTNRELAKRLNADASTMDSVYVELSRMQLVTREAQRNGQGGRPPIIWTLIDPARARELLDDANPVPDEVNPVPDEVDHEPVPTLARVEALVHQSLVLLERATKWGDARLALSAIREQRQTLELVAKLKGEIQSAALAAVQVNVGHQDDDDFDRQVSSVIASIKEKAAPRCGQCGELCSACASEALPPPRPIELPGLPAPVSDAVVVEDAPETRPGRLRGSCGRTAPHSAATAPLQPPTFMSLRAVSGGWHAPGRG